MTKPRRTFSAEFKREAADLVLKQNYSFVEASRSLSIGEAALRRWVDQLQQERTGVTPPSKALTPEQQKIQELEARIARLKLPARVTTHIASGAEHQGTNASAQIYSLIGNPPIFSACQK